MLLNAFDSESISFCALGFIFWVFLPTDLLETILSQQYSHKPSANRLGIPLLLHVCFFLFAFGNYRLHVPKDSLGSFTASGTLK